MHVCMLRDACTDGGMDGWVACADGWMGELVGS